MAVYTSKKWRLVHNGTDVITLIDGTKESITNTQHFVLEYDTKQDAIDAIAELGLKQEEPEW